jgi:AI-2 transport protein TqsA
MADSKKYWLNTGGVQTVSLAILASVALAFALSVTKGILIPFVLSLFLYFILAPLKAFFSRKLKLPSVLSLVLTFFVVLLILFITFYILVVTVQEFANGYEDYQAKAIYFAETTQVWLIEKGLPLSDVSFSDVISRIPFTDIAKGAGLGAFGIFSKTLLVFIFLIFIFTGVKAKTTDEVENEDSVYPEIDKQIRKYLGVKVLTSLTTGFLTYVFLSFLGLDLAFMFGFLAFILNFIPTIGSIVAVFLPLPVAFFQYDSMFSIMMVLALPGAVQLTIGNFIEPKIMGKKLNIHPVTVLLALMFWSLIWGIVGAFLAVPITVVLKIILNKIEGGSYISKLMAGDLS